MNDLNNYSYDINVYDSLKRQTAEKPEQVVPYRAKSQTIQFKSNSGIKGNEDGDIIDFTKTAEAKDKTVKAKSKTAKTKGKPAAANYKGAIAKGIAGVLATAMIYAGGANIVDKITPPSANFDAKTYNVEEVASLADIDERAIIIANNIKNEEAELGEIILPIEYKMYSDEISKLEEKLQNDKLSDGKKAKYEKELEELLAKQQKQDELADVYVDSENKYAYILPKALDTYAEDIKEAFGIKDGVIRNYNNLDYSWGKDGTDDMPGYYRDYTHSSVPYEGIKVPFDSLNKAK